MSIKGSFYPTSGTDRPYTYEDYNNNFKEVFTNGIASHGTALGTQMQVSAVAGTMKSQVALGVAYVQGVRSEVYNAAEQGTHTAAHVSNPRIDTVCLEVNFDAGVRNSRIVIVPGTPAGSPVAPTLTQTAIQYQYPLANVLVPAGATNASSFTYTDRRTISYVPAALNADNVGVIDAGGYFAGATVEAVLQEIGAKQAINPLAWALIKTQELVSSANSISIASQAGKTEMLICLCYSTSKGPGYTVIVPLAADGMPANSTSRVVDLLFRHTGDSPTPQSFSALTFNSATSLSITPLVPAGYGFYAGTTLKIYVR